MVWERLRWLNPLGTRGGFWVGAMLMLAVKPQWAMCTTSAECKIVITAMLTVMSGMDPHMISGNPGMGNG
jgi:hypothetical protein